MKDIKAPFELPGFAWSEAFQPARTGLFPFFFSALPAFSAVC